MITSSACWRPLSVAWAERAHDCLTWGRRLATLRDLVRRTVDARTPREVCLNAARVFEDNAIDVPFSVFYLQEAGGSVAQRVASVGIVPDLPAAPDALDLGAPDSTSGWPLARARATRELVAVDDVQARFGPLTGGPYAEPVRTAVLLPLWRPGLDRASGLLIAGVSPRDAFDDAYRGFYELAADYVATAIANAGAHDDEERADARRTPRSTARRR